MTPSRLLPAMLQSSLPLFLGLAGAGAGLYYAKEGGYLDGLLGAPPNGTAAAVSCQAHCKVAKRHPLGPRCRPCQAHTCTLAAGRQLQARLRRCAQGSGGPA